MIGLDFDNGVPFHIIQQKAEHYHLKMLFAYRTFSDTAEHEKFRVVFVLQHKITDSFTARSVVSIFMKIFENCDKACKDSARLFFGGKGLRYLTDEPHEISQGEIILALAAYMADKYDSKHYTRELQKFYAANHIRFEKNHPVITDQGSFIRETSPQTARSHASDKPKNGRRQVTRNLDWNTLYDRCRLYRDFFDGSEYYYYPELLHIATNLINIETCNSSQREDKQIYLKISSDEYKYIFNLKNSIDESVLKKNPALKTTKKEKSSHGYGTKIIRDIARKYHGKCDFYEEDGFFCCSVTLRK